MELKEKHLDKAGILYGVDQHGYIHIGGIFDSDLFRKKDQTGITSLGRLKTISNGYADFMQFSNLKSIGSLEVFGRQRFVHFADFTCTRRAFENQLKEIRSADQEDLPRLLVKLENDPNSFLLEAAKSRLEHEEQPC